MGENRFKWALAFSFLAASAAFAEETADVAEQVRYFTGKDNVLLSIPQIEAAGGLRESRIKHDAWSDDYWADMQRGIAKNWADTGSINLPLMPRVSLASFKRSRKKLWPKVLSLSPKELAVLSPAEKYDLIVGDLTFTLTRSVIDGIEFRHNHQIKFDASGTMMLDSNGDPLWEPRAGMPITPAWAGICNGWASASLALKRPTDAVVVKSAFGQEILLYPADIRALASHLWARSSINKATVTPGGPAVIRHMGVRCNEGGLANLGFKRDNAGRPSHPNCRDVFPAAWHLGVINKIGTDRVGFVMDENFKSGVSNHPVFAYRYSYFNPVSGENGSLKNSLMVRGSFEDPYAKYRSPKAAYIVGVEMKVWTLGWVSPKRESVNSHKDDPVNDATFIYDLELDANQNIIGGEWRFLKDDTTPWNLGMRMPNHPDFIWSPLPDWKAFSDFDRLIGVDYGTWLPGQPVPANLREAALKASTKSQPLAEVLDALIMLSRRNGGHQD